MTNTSVVWLWSKYHKRLYVYGRMRRYVEVYIYTRCSGLHVHSEVNVV